MSTRRSRHGGRAFTLIEIMVVISIILVLASLVLGVGSALLRRAERSQVESAITIMESAFTEWEGQTGRPMTYNGAFNAAMVEQWPSSATTVEIFDVRDPGAPPQPPPPQPAASTSKATAARVEEMVWGIRMIQSSRSAAIRSSRGGWVSNIRLIRDIRPSCSTRATGCSIMD